MKHSEMFYRTKTKFV